MKQGWVDKKLMEIADVSTGKYDANHSNENGKYRFYTCAYNYGMCDTNRFSGESLILPGNGVNVGEVFYYDGEFDAYQRTYVIDNIKIFPKYLHYHMLLFWKELGTKLQYGSATNFIKIGNFQNYDVSYPPLPEQQRIVAILDEAFAAIAKAKANAEQNLKNAKELFESFLQGVFENKGEGWEEKMLGEVVDFFNGFAFKSKDVIETSNTQLIRMGNLYQNQLSLERRAVFYPDDFAITYKKFLLKANDLIISLTGTTDKEDYGYTVRIPENEYNLLLNQRIAKISIKNEKATNKDYLFHFLLSRTFLDKLYKTANGTRQANLSTETMKGLYITIPSIKQQQIIVQKLDALSAETQKLEAIYQQKINDLEELKKSVLQKAFSGELN